MNRGPDISTAVVLSLVQLISRRFSCHIDHSLYKTCHPFYISPLCFALFLEDPNMAALEESFPRGGTRKIHKSEKPFQQLVEQDNLFNVSDRLLY
jgi:hypothetical protein